MRDFTFEIYSIMITVLKDSGYCFQTFQEFLEKPLEKVVLMRHDVDRKSNNAHKMARLEQSNQINSTYYFRTSTECQQPEIIKQISEMSHEIGYHYENLSTAAGELKIEDGILRTINRLFSETLKLRMTKSTNSKQDYMNNNEMEKQRGFEEIIDVVDSNLKSYIVKFFEIGIRDFESSLIKLRNIAPIKTISMHGSPMSSIDNRLLWLKYNYRDYGITSEPYFDIDYNDVFYITDAGRTWHDPKANQRDRVQTKYNFVFQNQNEITKALRAKKLPDRILINIHPEHWTDSTFEWYKIWAVRKGKNFVKRLILRQAE